MFLAKTGLKVSYKVYHSIFSTKFNISFSYPRSDTCSECDSLNGRMKTATDPAVTQQLKMDKKLHQTNAEAFYDLKRRVKSRCQANGEDLAVAFDFMQNLPMPNITTSQVFYLRQLWHYVFGVHNLGTGDVSMYTYHEGYARRGRDEVTLMLFHHLKGILTPTVKRLWLFSDGCPGQNKHYTMLHFSYLLVHGFHFIDEVTHVYPVRGHSYLPCDTDFRLIASHRKENVDVPEEWNANNRNARLNPSPFTFVDATKTDLFLNMTECIKGFFLRVPKPKIQLKPARMYRVSASKPGLISVRAGYKGAWLQHWITKKTQRIPDEIVFQQQQHPQRENIKPGKARDLLKLLPYLNNPENATFFRNLLICDENVAVDCETSAEIDSDANSSVVDDRD